jgi:acyl-CoA reductase-like NAD-dependent aldehyde dehydrogenase
LATCTDPVIVVHSLAQAGAALNAAAAAGRAIVLASAPEAGIYAGPGWWRELVAMAGAAVPAARFSAVLESGDEPGAALAANRARIAAVVFTGRADLARRLADIAGRHGVRLATDRPAAALDLAAEFFASGAAIERRCAEFLASPPPIC